MNVSQLIEKLKQEPPERKVVVKGYESGWDDIVNVTTERIIQNGAHEYYDGEYSTTKDNEQSFIAVIIE